MCVFFYPLLMGHLYFIDDGIQRDYWMQLCLSVFAAYREASLSDGSLLTGFTHMGTKIKAFVSFNCLFKKKKRKTSNELCIKNNPDRMQQTNAHRSLIGALFNGLFSLK